MHRFVIHDSIQTERFFENMTTDTEYNLDRLYEVAQQSNKIGHTVLHLAALYNHRLIKPLAEAFGSQRLSTLLSMQDDLRNKAHHYLSASLSLHHSCYGDTEKSEVFAAVNILLDNLEGEAADQVLLDKDKYDRNVLHRLAASGLSQTVQKAIAKLTSKGLADILIAAVGNIRDLIMWTVMCVAAMILYLVQFGLD